MGVMQLQPYDFVFRADPSMHVRLPSNAFRLFSSLRSLRTVRWAADDSDSDSRLSSRAPTLQYCCFQFPALSYPVRSPTVGKREISIHYLLLL